MGLLEWFTYTKDILKRKRYNYWYLLLKIAAIFLQTIFVIKIVQ